MYTVDVHSNKETTKVAIDMLEASLEFGRKDKDRVICLITGYGSKSGHGRIKEAIIMTRYLLTSFPAFSYI